MNTYSHLVCAGILLEYFERRQSARLNKTGFLLGSILPDYDFSVVRGMHTVENFWDDIQDDIRRLAAERMRGPLRSDFQFSKRLGMISHYFMDFFCFAHSERFEQTVRNHLRYEKALEVYLLDNFDLFRRTEFLGIEQFSDSEDEIISYIDRLNKSFLSDESIGHSREIVDALTACALAGGMILARVRGCSRVGAAETEAGLCRAAV